MKGETVELTQLAEEALRVANLEEPLCSKKVEKFINGLGGGDGFWYEMTCGQQLEPLVRRVLADNDDVERVLQAFAVVEEFEEIWRSITWEY